MSDVTLARSTDGGRTWSNTQVSDTSFDSRVGPTADARFGTDFGSRLGLTAAPDRSVAAWTDSRLGNDATGRQDVVLATVGRPRPVPILARWAVVAVLAVVGIVAVVTAWSRSSRSKAGRRAAEATRQG
jgi:hypothetical protein